MGLAGAGGSEQVLLSRMIVRFPKMGIVPYSGVVTLTWEIKRERKI